MLALWLDPLGAMELNPDSSLRPLATIVVPGEPLIFAKKKRGFSSGLGGAKSDTFQRAPNASRMSGRFQDLSGPSDSSSPFFAQ